MLVHIRLSNVRDNGGHLMQSLEDENKCIFYRNEILGDSIIFYHVIDVAVFRHYGKGMS